MNGAPLRAHRSAAALAPNSFANPGARTNFTHQYIVTVGLGKDARWHSRESFTIQSPNRFPSRVLRRRQEHPTRRGAREESFPRRSLLVFPSRPEPAGFSRRRLTSSERTSEREGPQPCATGRNAANAVTPPGVGAVGTSRKRWRAFRKVSGARARDRRTSRRRGRELFFDDGGAS